LRNHNFSILVVYKDPIEGRNLTEDLRNKGFSALAADDCRHAMSILEFRAFDALLLEMAIIDTEGTGLLTLARGICPAPKIIAVGESAADPKGSGGLDGKGLVLQKPPDINALTHHLIANRKRSSFSGKVDNVDLVDYLQFTLLAGLETILQITSNLGTQAKIFVREGAIVHAECGLLSGEQAFYRCLCFKIGTFEHLPWQTPERMTIAKPGEFLLMEAVRKRDEAWSQQENK
jgi:CheY-like chemotaxis protein